MPALRHVHTYIKSRTNKDVRMCAHPECSHFVNIRQVDLHGKKAKCKCGADFIINANDPDRHLRKAEMKCPQCTNQRRGKVLKVAENVIADVLNMVPMPEVILNKPTEAPAQLDLPTEKPEGQSDMFDDDMSGFPVDSEESDSDEKKGAA